MITVVIVGCPMSFFLDMGESMTAVANRYLLDVETSGFFMEKIPIQSKRWRIHADTVSLLSLGLQLTYVLGIFTSELGKRGWPSWLRACLPNFITPHFVLFALPFVSLVTCVVSLLMAVSEVSSGIQSDTKIPWICWASLVGLDGILLFTAVIFFLFAYNLTITLIALMCIAAILGSIIFAKSILRHSARRR